MVLKSLALFHKWFIFPIGEYANRNHCHDRSIKWFWLALLIIMICILYQAQGIVFLHYFVFRLKYRYSFVFDLFKKNDIEIWCNENQISYYDFSVYETNEDFDNDILIGFGEKDYYFFGFKNKNDAMACKLAWS